MEASRQQTWLITGAAGFLGRHLVVQAAARGHRVVAMVRGEEPVDAARTVRRELLDPCAFEGLAPDVVLNAAALSRVGDCERDPQLAERVNRELPARIGRELARAHIVHVSTDLVFGHQPVPAAGFSEVSEPEPASIYGATKLAGERALAAARPDALIVRLPLLSGDSYGRGVGATDALSAALLRGERPRLFTDEFRTPLDVAVAARALVRLAELGTSGLLHVAGSSRLSRFQLGAASVGAAAVEPTTRAEAGCAERPADTSLDGRRALTLLGLRSIEELAST
ncbi:MAG: sugar nucleotide-binding protein [Planctomycetota bacterium]